MINNIIFTLFTTEDGCERLKSNPSPISFGITFLNLIIGNIIWHIPAILAYSFSADLIFFVCMMYRFIKI